MGTSVGQFEGPAWTGFGLGVLFDGKWKMDYDDHTVEDTFPRG
jgi:hypothetical protein